ncbi:unnamed protein product [Sphenostylis stenocarpa]|uniref:BAG domain-containing protein n=1 Tax=Sphenostylis stenocarpa TaxID=92480 RepID=A0AA86V9J4_9FABA|nr:unnamed protein product [Sphenostylis stenocarpa]
MMQMKNTPFNRTGWGMVEPVYHKAPSKVVCIPVHFVGSERTRTDSAIKIQRVFRGFLVRKTLKKIATMRMELARIESEIRVDLVKREQKERVKVIETIMNLLIKLDSVRVLHYTGLRECRKSVIKNAIALQEMLDQMAVPDSDEDMKMEEGNECIVEEENCLVKEEKDSGMENMRNDEVEKEKGDCMEEEYIGLETSLVEEEEGEMECEEKQEEGEELEALRNEEQVEEKESVGTSLAVENCLVKEEEGDCGREEGDGKQRELLMEKMVEDNYKMMEMMAQLFQRNEMQSTLLTSLSQRVEQLKRALACEKLRRNKKRKANGKNKQIHPKNCFI